MKKTGNGIWWRVIGCLLFGLVMVGVILYANQDKPTYTITEDSGIEYETAKVLSVTEDKTFVDQSVEGVIKGSTTLDLKILTGRYKGNVAKGVTNYFSALYQVDVKAGDTVSVRIDTTGEGIYQVSIYNYNRKPIIIGMIVFFCLILLLVGGKSGLKAFAGLLYTFICIVFILLPLCLKGFSPIPLTCAIILLTTTVCFILIGGIQKKTMTAAAGSLCGVILAAIFGQVTSELAGISTFQTDEAEALLLVKSTFDLNMRGLFTSGILIAAMGAVMDVAMTISSAVEEVHLANTDYSVKELFQSAMKIGKDAMGTMANTLVLAYVGSSLNMMVLIYSYGVSFTQLINTDFVAIELIRAIAGSIGIIGTVPCVAILSAVVFSQKK